MESSKSKSTISEAVSWYTDIKPVYERLSTKVESIIQEIIKDNDISVHAIYSRAKEIKSFAKKIEDPKYTHPQEQITDFSGIRIIAYVESDLEKISKIVKDHFDVDAEKSIDKSESLGTDKVGYRSIHFIAALPADRLKLPEYAKFKGLCFEIQIRTILQHAWAEIEHDKDYKFSGELPKYLKRRFRVLAGVLELADREFNQIAEEIDKYSRVVQDETKKGQLEIEIDSTSIKSFLRVKFEKLIKKGLQADFVSDDFEKTVLNELRLFGISNLKELDKIIPADFVRKILKYENRPGDNPNNFGGILRHLMLINNAEKYFKECWNNNWQGIDESTVNLIRTYNEQIDIILEEHEINEHEI